MGSERNHKNRQSESLKRTWALQTNLAPRAGLEPNARHNSALMHYAGPSGAVILSVEIIHDRPTGSIREPTWYLPSRIPVLPRYDHHWLSGIIQPPDIKNLQQECSRNYNRVGEDFSEN